MHNRNYLLAEIIVIISILAIVAIGMDNRVTGLYAGSYASVEVSTDRIAYTEGDTVSIFVSVKGYMPADTMVALSVIRPDSGFTTKYLKTDGNGNIKYGHFLNVGSPHGTYAVGATAYRSGDAFKGKATFEVG